MGISVGLVVPCRTDLGLLAALRSDDPHLGFMPVVELNLAGGFAWWPNLMTRLLVERAVAGGYPR